VAVNRALARRMVRVHADPCAVDVSRILRVAGTINGKNGGLVHIVWLNGSTGAPTTYDFDAFAKATLPATATSNPDGLRHNGLIEERRNMSWQERVAYKAASRYPGGIVQPGQRDLYGHLAACQIARVIMAGPLFHEITAIARTFLPAGYVDGGEFRSAEGEKVTFGNHQRTPIYTYSKGRLMELLEVHAGRRAEDDAADQRCGEAAPGDRALAGGGDDRARRIRGSGFRTVGDSALAAGRGTVVARGRGAYGTVECRRRAQIGGTHGCAMKADRSALHLLLCPPSGVVE
jgi:hypothetical protein